MKKLRWSTPASDDLQHIRQRIEADNPRAAIQTVRTIYDAMRSLKSFPHRGRLGAEEGTRELVCAPLALHHRIWHHPTHVELFRIWHGAQDR